MNTIFLNGTTYSGEIYNNKKHGHGILNTMSGEKYEGEFEYGAYSGYGKHTFGQWTYVGQHYDGLRHGYGELVNTVTGEFYKGYFMDGFPHGFGMASLYGNEKTAIKGQWANGKYLYRTFYPNAKL